MTAALQLECMISALAVEHNRECKEPVHSVVDTLTTYHQYRSESHGALSQLECQFDRVKFVANHDVNTLAVCIAVAV